MKVLTSILSLYIVTLVLVPCADTHERDAEYQAICIVADQQNAHSDVDLCSPFCFCNCCQTLTHPAHSTHYQFEVARDFFKGSIQKQYYSQHLLKFWHPPKA